MQACGQQASSFKWLPVQSVRRGSHLRDSTHTTASKCRPPHMCDHDAFLFCWSMCLYRLNGFLFANQANNQSGPRGCFALDTYTQGHYESCFLSLYAPRCYKASTLSGLSHLGAAALHEAWRCTPSHASSSAVGKLPGASPCRPPCSSDKPCQVSAPSATLYSCRALSIDAAWSSLLLTTL